ncbi:sensor domain-containing diguanylate cyclase [Cupriavidus basilensis]
MAMAYPGESRDDLAALAAENEELLTFLYMSPAGILRIDAAGNVAMANPKAAQVLMPISRTGSLDNLFTVFEDLAPELRSMAATFAHERGYICENHRIFLPTRKQQEPNVLSCSMLRVARDCTMVVLTDISKVVAQERSLKQTESWLAAVYSAVNDFAFFSLDATGRIDSWNQSGQRQTGFELQDVEGATLRLFCHPDSDFPARVNEQLRLTRESGWHVEELWCVTRDGRRYWGQLLVAALEEIDGKVSGYSVVLRDVTERKLSVDKVKELLTRDHLTGAANRGHFFDVGEAEVVRARRLRQPLSVVMLDADHFKAINDNLGHAAGDHVLKELVTCCQGVLRAIDIIARLGGEEFALLLPSTDADGARATAQRIRQAVEQHAFHFNGVDIRCTVSLGCATMPGAGGTLDDVLAAADKALYQAKAAGRNCVASQD